jgi:hypothetical protein
VREFDGRDRAQPRQEHELQPVRERHDIGAERGAKRRRRREVIAPFLRGPQIVFDPIGAARKQELAWQPVLGQSLGFGQQPSGRAVALDPLCALLRSRRRREYEKLDVFDLLPVVVLEVVLRRLPHLVLEAPHGLSGVESAPPLVMERARDVHDLAVAFILPLPHHRIAGGEFSIDQISEG